MIRDWARVFPQIIPQCRTGDDVGGDSACKVDYASAGTVFERGNESCRQRDSGVHVVDAPGRANSATGKSNRSWLERDRLIVAGATSG